MACCKWRGVEANKDGTMPDDDGRACSGAEEACEFAKCTAADADADAGAALDKDLMGSALRGAVRPTPTLNGDEGLRDTWSYTPPPPLLLLLLLPRLPRLPLLSEA